MKANLNLTGILSMLFMCFMTLTFAQETKKKSVSDVLYEEYQNTDIENALTRYRDLKAKESKNYDFNEYQLNRLGYQILDDGDLEAAEKVFKLNIEEYPQAANPHDSYADYLMEKGDQKEARKHYEKAVSMAEKSTRDDEKELLRMSKAKLAKLDNKHKQLDFLVGKWDVKSTNLEEGLGSGTYSGVDEYVQNKEENLITINHLNERGEIVGKRLMVYDAVDDEYDVAYIDTRTPLGISVSTMKLKETGEDTYELSEKFLNAKENNKKIKHELKKKQDGSMDWVIYETEANSNDWKKVYVMDMKKNN